MCTVELTYMYESFITVGVQTCEKTKTKLLHGLHVIYVLHQVGRLQRFVN